jgi:hypothetical protein
LILGPHRRLANRNDNPVGYRELIREECHTLFLLGGNTFASYSDITLPKGSRGYQLIASNKRTVKRALFMVLWYA